MTIDLGKVTCPNVLEAIQYDGKETTLKFPDGSITFARSSGHIAAYLGANRKGPKLATTWISDRIDINLAELSRGLALPIEYDSGWKIDWSCHLLHDYSDLRKTAA